jgi:hypothetical protein
MYLNLTQFINLKIEYTNLFCMVKYTQVTKIYLKIYVCHNFIIM